MNNESPNARWTVQQALMRLSTPWVDLIGERLLTHQQQAVDYWRVERADSAIIIPRWRQQIILPPSTYRPGIGKVTLDFPGGRILPQQSPREAAQAILQRELGLADHAIARLTPLNQAGWPVDSSFTNQRLFGFHAIIQDQTQIPSAAIGYSVPAEARGLAELRQVLSCLQCRAVLLEFASTENNGIEPHPDSL